MKEIKNVVSITGQLVKNDLSEFTTKKGAEAIGGSLIIRTADKSEHEVRFFSNKYKKDENKNFTSELNYFYEKYVDAMDNLKDMEHCDKDKGEMPDMVSITDGVFVANDFKGSDGNVVSTNKINARFINKVEPKDYETTVSSAKFEVEGVIESIKDEIVKNVPTGNLVVTMLAIGQRANGFGKDATYEADSLIPIRMIVDEEMATMFRSAGYYDGCFTKFVGDVVNTTELVKTVEKAAFGADIEKTVKNTVRKNVIKSGSAPSSIYEHELTDDIMNALKAKRKAVLAEVASGVSSDANDELPFKPATNPTPAPTPSYNPFAMN